MDFSQDEQLDIITQSVREFALKEIKPHVMDWDERQYFPKELFHKFGEMGWMKTENSSRMNRPGLG